MTAGTNQVAEVARGLTEAQRRALAVFYGPWIAGPSLPDEIIAEIPALRQMGLLERNFLDEGPPVQSVGDRSITVKLSACWHFRLTPLGLAVRAHLLAAGREG